MYQEDGKWYYLVDWWYNYKLPTKEHEVFYGPSVIAADDDIVKTEYVFNAFLLLHTVDSSNWLKNTSCAGLLNQGANCLFRTILRKQDWMLWVPTTRDAPNTIIHGAKEFRVMRNTRNTSSTSAAKLSVFALKHLKMFNDIQYSFIFEWFDANLKVWSWIVYNCSCRWRDMMWRWRCDTVQLRVCYTHNIYMCIFL